MSECPICAEPLGDASKDHLIPHFLAHCEKDSDVNESIFRLSCGHAQHNACLVRHLRQSRECPTCRGTHQGPANGGEFNAAWNDSDAPLDVIVEINSQGQMNIRGLGPMDADIGLASSHVPSWNSIQTVSDLRVRNKQVQKARRKFNVCKRDQINLEHNLIQRRANVLRTALAKFRDDEQGNYRRVLAKLKKSLAKVRQTERNALLNLIGTEKTDEIFRDLDSSEYSIKSVQQRHVVEILDPSRRSFWYRGPLHEDDI